MTIRVENDWDSDNDNQEANELGKKIVGVGAVEEAVVEAPENSSGESELNVFPGRFVDGGKEADNAILMGPIVKEMSEGTDNRYDGDAEPETKYVIHRIIIA